MSCAFCHASYHPLKPPRDLVNPQWENISGNIGAQYLRPRAVFGNLPPKNNFVFHLLDSQPPGTIDTSLIASDNINNPNAMNSIFNLRFRAALSLINPHEKQSGPSRALPSIWRNPEENPPPGAPDQTPQAFRDLFEHVGLSNELHHSNDDPRRVPRILFDGADSIGAWGALARVYLNIGTNYEQWITLQNTVIGMRPQQSFTIANVGKHSIYWYGTELRVPALRDYFLKVTPPMPLLAADGGEGRFYRSGTAAGAALSAEERRRRVDIDKLAAGRKVFARNCIVCHSSIQPPERVADMQSVAKTAEIWDHNPGRWLSEPSYLKWADEQIEKPAFWQQNYLSTDYRIPINLVQTNACRAMATNAMNGNMWEDFASDSYRHLPSVGFIPFFNPYLGEHGGDDRFSPRMPRAAARGARRSRLLPRADPGFDLDDRAAAAQQQPRHLHQRSVDRRPPHRVRRCDSQAAVAGAASSEQQLQRCDRRSSESGPRADLAHDRGQLPDAAGALRPARLRLAIGADCEVEGAPPVPEGHPEEVLAGAERRAFRARIFRAGAGVDVPLADGGLSVDRRRAGGRPPRLLRQWRAARRPPRSDSKRNAGQPPGEREPRCR
jgi:hypothetical protein